MTDSAPQEISGSSTSYPSVNGGSTVQGAKDTVVSSRLLPNALLQNSRVDIHLQMRQVLSTQFKMQSLLKMSKTLATNDTFRGNPSSDSCTGPVAENVKAQYNTTQHELSNLANSRQRPDHTAATGQQLTHYHSMFYSLLSWENPRATAIAFTANVLIIFAARYLHITSYLFKILFYTLGATASAEIVGKLVFHNGLTSQIRPKRYYTIPKDTLELVLDDVQELINFFVIEFQRVLFAENVSHTVGAFLASLVSYLLIKFLPFWGLTLLGTSVLYLGPLIYLNNKEAIDTQVANASDIVSKQANQVKDIAGHHTARATDTVKGYAGDYSSKAQQYIGNARGRVGSPLGDASSTTTKPLVSSSDFPSAPKQNPISSTSSTSAPTKVGEQEPLI